MLLVIGAQPAIVRAALIDLRAVGVRLPRGLAVFVPVVIGDVGTDEVFNQAVLDFITSVEQGAWTPRRDTTTGLLPPDARR